MDIFDTFAVELREMAQKVAEHEARIASLESQPVPDPTPDPVPDPTPDPPPVDHSLLRPFPGFVRTVEIGPGPLDRVADLVNAAEPGTRILMKAGDYEARGNTRFNFSGDDSGAVTLQALGDVSIVSPQWTAGERGYQIIATGANFGIHGLHFEGVHKGSHLLIEKCNEVWIDRCTFRGSWRHSFHYIAANNVCIRGNSWFGNNLFNRDHSAGVWPFVAGGWHHRNGIWNTGIHWEGNTFWANHGEALHCSFTDGFTIRGNHVTNAINALCYLHTSRNGVVEGNTFEATEEYRNVNGALSQAAIRIQCELQNFTADAQGEGTKPTENITIRNNTIIGNGKIRSGIWSKAHSSYPAADSAYGNIRIQGNVITGLTEKPIVFEKWPSGPTAMNYSDWPVVTPDADWWGIG